MTKETSKRSSTKKVARKTGVKSQNQRAHGQVKGNTSGTGSTGPKMIKPSKKS